MGQSELRSVIMKFLLVLSLAAAVQAEADPGFAYTVGGHFLPYAVGHHATLLHTHASGCTNVAGAVVPCAHGFPVLGVAAPAAAPEAAAVETVERKKREAEPEAEAEAEADPEADPWVYYSTHGYWPVGYSHYAPHAYSYSPFTYSGHYGYYGLGHHGYFGKREAEPEAEAEADPWLLYGSHYGGPLAYGGHYGYGYHHALPYYFASAGECRNNQGSLVPCALGR